MKKAIRPIRVEGNIAFVPLTRGYEAMIDAEDAPLVEGLNWYVKIRARTVYAASTCPVEKREIKMHRVIGNPPNGTIVDHINGNGIDNRKYNLRICTKTQNNQNARLKLNNKTGYKGVYFSRAEKKWKAQIRHNKVKAHLGTFDNPEDAYEAYCNASAQYHGEFGRFA